MLRDKIVYALTHYPGVTDEIAKAMKQAGITSPKKLKALSVDEIRAFGLSKANADKIKERGKK